MSTATAAERSGGQVPEVTPAEGYVDGSSFAGSSSTAGADRRCRRATVSDMFRGLDGDGSRGGLF